MQVASTDAENENMAPEDITFQINKDTSTEIQLNQTQVADGNGRYLSKFMFHIGY